VATLNGLIGDEEIERTCSHHSTALAMREISFLLNSGIWKAGSIQKLCTFINRSVSFSIALSHLVLNVVLINLK